MKAITLTIACILGLVLQACSSVVLPTLAALNGMSPLTADPEGFEIAVDIPVGVGVRQDGAVFSIEMSRSDTGEALSGDYALERRTAMDGRSLFRIDPSDLEDLRAKQATAVAWETEAPVASTGSFSVYVYLCKKDDGPEPDDTYSVSIRTTADGPFMPLIQNASVADTIEQLDTLELDAEDDLFNKDAPCE